MSHKQASTNLPNPCPICELILCQQFVSSNTAGCEICSDCDYLIDLGFSNYDEQPETYLYPASWVYDRLFALTGRNYLQSKRLWLDEVIEYFEEMISAGPDAGQDFQRRRGITPEQAIRDTQQDIERVEQLLAE